MVPMQNTNAAQEIKNCMKQCFKTKLRRSMILKQFSPFLRKRDWEIFHKYEQQSTTKDAKVVLTTVLSQYVLALSQKSAEKFNSSIDRQTFTNQYVNRI